MVVQEDDTPVEAPVAKQSKKYVIVKNHVRELLPEAVDSRSVAPLKQEPSECNKMKTKNLKRKKQSKESFTIKLESLDINPSDIEELRTVYKNCKQILKKIESKYGHLLNLDDNDNKQSKTTGEESGSDSCSCSRTKKILFDENGQQIEKVCELENHICLKKIKQKHSDQIKISEIQHPKPAIQIEYDQYEKISSELTDNLVELGAILRDPTIDDVYRKMVIDKIYMKRQDKLFEMRNERKFLIEQLKLNANEFLDFKGSNISILPGYPKNPLDISEEKQSEIQS